MYKRLASLLSSKRSEPYSTTINWIRCRIGFALLRSMIMCLREADSFHLHFIRDSAENCDSPMDLAISEGRIYRITSYLQPQCNYCDCTIVLYCVAVDVLFYHRRTSMVLLIEVFLVLKGICSPPVLGSYTGLPCFHLSCHCFSYQALQLLHHLHSPTLSCPLLHL